MMFICKLFQIRWKGWSSVGWRFPRLVHVKTIALFIPHVQYLAETLLSNMRRGKRQ